MLPNKSFLILDEPDDFNFDELCKNCGHMLYFTHSIHTHDASDGRTNIVTVWKCNVKGCNCIIIS